MSNSSSKLQSRPLSTREFAAQNLIKPESVIARLSRTGSYFGRKPKKLENGRLDWGDDQHADQGAA